jgi:hypothetical protein
MLRQDSSTQKFYIINMVSIFFLLEIDFLFDAKILHKCTNVTCTF